MRSLRGTVRGKRGFMPKPAFASLVKQEQPDVVVVGASPAGLRAAWAAAREGARVELLERREVLGVPEPPAAVAFDFLWRASFRPPPFAVRRRLEGVRLASPGGHELTVDAPVSILRRARLDPWLAEEAKATGARVTLGVRELRARSDRSLVVDGRELRPRVLVFCDGAQTLARRYLQPVEDPDAVTWGVALDVAAPGSETASRLRIAVGQRLPFGRSQLNPLDDGRWSHWTFYRGEQAGAEERARAALALDAAHMGWPEDVAKHATLTGIAADAVYTIPHQLVTDGVMVAGGAAGQGGLELGLAAGERAGRIAAQAALAGRTDRAGLRPYERAWMREHVTGYRSLRRATERLAALPDEDVDALFAAFSGRRLTVGDLADLAHPSGLRRARAGLRALSWNPRAAPSVARIALKALVS